MQHDKGKPPSGKFGGERISTELPKREQIDSILAGDVKRLVTWASKVGGGLAQNERLTTAQVRTFFGEVRQIEADSGPDPQTLSDKAFRRLVLLKPKLAYQAQREREARKGEGVARLAEVLSEAIDSVQNDAVRFKHFVEFFEAILAYHKAAGGRDS
jgi:CRISPR-associated protein Csm2